VLSTIDVIVGATGAPKAGVMLGAINARERAAVKSLVL
jgi:hypothetical protein